MWLPHDILSYCNNEIFKVLVLKLNMPAYKHDQLTIPSDKHDHLDKRKKKKKSRKQAQLLSLSQIT